MLTVKPIKPFETYPWILEKHYAKRVPSISFAFGLFSGNSLVGIVTYGKPASPSLCDGICGEQNSHLVYELNRLCLMDNNKNEASFLVAHSLRQLPKPTIVVSYADKAMNHVGYVYQATNFLYTGFTKERTDIGSEDGTHSRHYEKGGDYSIRKFRSSKHRYVYFVGNKRDKKRLLREFNYVVEPYPKGESQNYDASGKVEVQGVLF